MIAIGGGECDRAEELLRRAWRGFQSLSLRHDWGLVLVALDLAGFYAQCGRRGGLKKFAGEMSSMLFWPGLHREAVTAVGKLLREIEFEAVGVEAIQSVASYVQRSRFCPGLTFELSC